MGTWGAGNFQNDGCLDWLASQLGRLTDTIDANLRDVDESNDQLITAAVEVVALLCEQLNAVPPKPMRVVGWRDAYVRAWEGFIDALAPRGDYKLRRRAVIDATFARLLTAASAWHATPLRIDFEAALSDPEREQLRTELHAALAAAEAGELTGGETFTEPDENDTLTVLTGRAFVRDTARDILRQALCARNVESARWICFGDPFDEFAEAWCTPDPT